MRERRKNPELTKALGALARAGFTLADVLDLAQHAALLRAPGIGPKALYRLIDHARKEKLCP